MIWKNWELIGYVVAYTKTGHSTDFKDFSTLEEVKHFVAQNRDCWVNYEVTKSLRMVCDF